MQLEVTATYRDYADAATLLWGPAGRYAADEFTRLNREHFAGSIPPLPIVIGITAYGGCIGLTRYHATPRITLASELFNGSHRQPGGPLAVSDTLIHEMLHAYLLLRGENTEHNAPPWCRMITELTPALTGREINAEPVRTMRVPNPGRDTDPEAPKTMVVRRPEPGCLTQKQLGRWPHSIRAESDYDGQEPIPVDTY
jgi:hypothetical protein